MRTSVQKKISKNLDTVFFNFLCSRVNFWVKKLVPPQPDLLFYFPKDYLQAEFTAFLNTIAFQTIRWFGTISNGKSKKGFFRLKNISCLFYNSIFEEKKSEGDQNCCLICRLRGIVKHLLGLTGFLKIYIKQYCFYYIFSCNIF